ncbi:MAG TPA: hypothetical protein VNR65_10825 [Geobacterales bacterium]|nr:hypothetical protein [Geobacterales bacterium]
MKVILKGVAFVMALLLLPISISGAIAGDWAVAGDGCKVWNPNPTTGENIRWTGPCKDGIVEGMGTLEWQRSGKTYERDEGQWRGGHQISGSQVWPGGQYDGQFADSLPNGRGVLVFGDARYEGQFVNGKPNGKGTLTNASGSFDGNWADGCFNDGKHRAAIGVSLQSCP